MEMMEISKLKEHPRNREFFDDIAGERWDDFKESVVRRGVVEPIVVTQDLTIVSGHQRVRACKELGLLNLPCSIRHYDDENLIMEDLISTNIMQRGIGNVNPMKMARCIIELERIKGIKVGKPSSNSEIISEYNQKSLAEQIGLDERQLRNYKQLSNLIPELQDLIETNQMKATVGYKIWAKMDVEEQEKFFNEIGRDKIKTMTQKATQQYIDENNRLKSELNIEKNKPEKVKEVYVEVDKTDYVAISNANKIKDSYESLKRERDNLAERLDVSQKLRDSYERDSNEYKKLKEEMTYLTQQKDDFSRRIQALTDLGTLAQELDIFIKQKLAPVKYSKSLLEAKDDEVVVRNISEAVDVVKMWVNEIEQYIPKEINYVEVL